MINVTPYDAWLEKVCLEWHKSAPIRISHISVSLNSGLIDYVQKVLAMKLMEVWVVFHCFSAITLIQTSTQF